MRLAHTLGHAKLANGKGWAASRRVRLVSLETAPTKAPSISSSAASGSSAAAQWTQRSLGLESSLTLGITSRNSAVPIASANVPTSGGARYGRFRPGSGDLRYDSDTRRAPRRWPTRCPIPGSPVARPLTPLNSIELTAAGLWSVSAPLLEEEGSFGFECLVPDLADPLDFHRSVVGAGLSAN